MFLTPSDLEHCHSSLPSIHFFDTKIKLKLLKTNKQIKWYLNCYKEINTFVAVCFFLRVRRKIGKELIIVNEVIGRTKKAVRNKGKCCVSFNSNIPHYNNGDWFIKLVYSVITFTHTEEEAFSYLPIGA